MKFHLDYTPPPAGFCIHHKSKLMLMGSCFSEHIGNALQERAFPVYTNPDGIVFNPHSMALSLEKAMNMDAVDESCFVERNGTVFSYLHHSSVSANDATALKTILQEKREETHHQLKQAEVLLLTFGSAFHYQLKSNRQIVANCHKQNPDLFIKQLADLETLLNFYRRVIKQLLDFSPNLKIVLTVSPVKHLRDGLIENTISKSTLLLFVHHLCKEFSNCSYFPAYELVNDDLRDYRFYKEDLAHPNQQAIDYVWEKFSDCFFNEQTKQLNREIEKLNKAKAHRVLHPTGEQDATHQAFMARQTQIIRELNPEIGF